MCRLLTEAPPCIFVFMHGPVSAHSLPIVVQLPESSVAEARSSSCVAQPEETFAEAAAKPAAPDADLAPAHNGGNAATDEKTDGDAPSAASSDSGGAAAAKPSTSGTSGAAGKKKKNQKRKGGGH